MIAYLSNLMTSKRSVKRSRILVIFTILLLYPISILHALKDGSSDTAIIYRNPKVFNVDYTFELYPDSDTIDRSKDLKLWIPVPREWESQKAVNIIAIEPAPHARFKDLEHGNEMLYWDFGKEPAAEFYKVNIKYRVEVYEIHSVIDPEKIEPYDTSSTAYNLYTRNTYKISITPKIVDLAQTAVGEEKNTYLKAKRIFEFVRAKMRYKSMGGDQRSSIQSIVDSPVFDEKTGEQYYEGLCTHFAIFFVALCRAAGIPARGITGFVGWDPWINKEDLKLLNKRHTEITADGLSATRIYGPMIGHIWAEVYLPPYGWIPVDPTWARFGEQSNIKLIISKGREIMIGPNAPRENSEGYGDQWIPLHHGRADALGWGVRNIAKIRIAKVILLQHSDPFPADAYVQYNKNLFPESGNEKRMKDWRERTLRSFYNSHKGDNTGGNIFETDPWLNLDREAYLCHLLRQIVGDDAFQKIFQTYLEIRLTNEEPVPVETFQNIAERIHGNSLDLFFREWVNRTVLPEFRLDPVTIQKTDNKWLLHGSVVQPYNYHLPLSVQVVLETQDGKHIQNVSLDEKKNEFEFHIPCLPNKLIVDPDYHIPMIRWIPSRIRSFWDFHPDGIILYGTSMEDEANKNAAVIIDDKWLGLGKNSIKPDTCATTEDLDKHFVILIGRPATNKMTQQIKKELPIRFDNDSFTCKGSTYDKPSFSTVFITESPLNPYGWIILFAGLSESSTLQISKLSPFRPAASYIIFDESDVVSSGNWDNIHNDLEWSETDF